MDPYQLPPIETSKDSITFKHTKSELLTPIRYTGSLVQLGQRIRDEIDKVNKDEQATKFVINEWMSELNEDSRVSRVDENGSGYIFLNDINKVIEISTNIFKSNENSEAIKLLAYRNSSIEMLNDVLRAHIYTSNEMNTDDEKLPQFMPGELVICNGGYNVYFENRNYNIIYNNQTFKVIDSKEITGPFNIPCLALSLNPAPNLPPGQEIICLDWEKGRHQYFEILNEEKRKAKISKNWKTYYHFKNSFCWFDYNYAQNAHRA